MVKASGLAEMTGFSQTQNHDSLPWPCVETLTSVKQYLAFLSRRSGRAFTMVMCISAVLEGNAARHLLKLTYPQTFHLLKSLISSHETPEEVWKILPSASLTQHLPGTASPKSQPPAVGHLSPVHLFQKRFSMCALQLCTSFWRHSRGQDRH